MLLKFSLKFSLYQAPKPPGWWMGELLPDDWGAARHTYGYCRRSLVHLDQGPEPRKEQILGGFELRFPTNLPDSHPAGLVPSWELALSIRGSRSA